MCILTSLCCVSNYNGLSLVWCRLALARAQLQVLAMCDELEGLVGESGDGKRTALDDLSPLNPAGPSLQVCFFFWVVYVRA